MYIPPDDIQMTRAPGASDGPEQFGEQVRTDEVRRKGELHARWVRTAIGGQRAGIVQEHVHRAAVGDRGCEVPDLIEVAGVQRHTCRDVASHAGVDVSGHGLGPLERS